MAVFRPRKIGPGECEEIARAALETLDRLKDYVTPEEWERAHSLLSRAKNAPGKFGELMIMQVSMFAEILKIREFVERGKTAGSDAQAAEDELSALIAEFEAMNDQRGETGLAYIDHNPFLSGLQKRGPESREETAITIYGKSDLIIEGGDIDPYQREIIDNLLKARIEGRILNGKITFTTGQMGKWISGGATDSMSKKQTEEIVEALKELNARRIDYKTTVTLAQILGIQPEGEFGDFAASVKAGAVNAPLITAVFYRDLTYKSRKMIDGQLVQVTLEEHFERMLDKLQWYTPIKAEYKRIQVETETGELKGWKLTKDRIALRTCILEFVTAYIRARKRGKTYSPLKPYNDIFAECGIDTTHRQTRARRIKDIAVILDHLKRMGMIAGWDEYTNRGSKRPDGIRIFIAKELLESGAE